MPQVTIKVADLVNGFEALQELGSRKLKINPSFWLARQQRKLRLDYASFIDNRFQLIQQYGTENPPGSGTWTVKPENGKAYNDAVKELVDGDMSVDVEPRPVAFLALDDVEPRLLAATWFLWTDEAPAAG